MEAKATVRFKPQFTGHLSGGDEKRLIKDYDKDIRQAARVKYATCLWLFDVLMRTNNLAMPIDQRLECYRRIQKELDKL